MALSGVEAGNTRLCSVGSSGNDLYYRGYDILDIAEKCEFEEIAHLLIYKKLPTQKELDCYKEKLIRQRGLSKNTLTILEQLPASSHPMSVLQTATSAIGCMVLEKKISNDVEELSNSLLANLGTALIYWYHFSHSNKRICLESDSDSIAGHFLNLLHTNKCNDEWIHAMQTSLNLYAEHEFNASTFTGRVCASTMSDIHSCVVAAIGSLRGPLHGGANEKAMELIENWTSRDEAKTNILEMLANKEKIMGFGHAVYSIRDPRNAVIKEYAKELSLLHENDDLYQVAEEVEKVMADEKKMFANADFFHAPAYFYMGIPTKLFTPIFVMSRVSGWTAHCMEQRANNRIIRPSADYIGVESSEWIDIQDRS